MHREKEEANKRKIGGEAEEAAALFLERQGYRILCRNFFSKSGELDIIAREKEYLVFIEVKYRRDGEKGAPEEAVDARKIRSIVRSARYYMLKNGISEDTPCRFDLVAIAGEECRLLRDAFDSPY